MDVVALSVDDVDNDLDGDGVVEAVDDVDNEVLADTDAAGDLDAEAVDDGSDVDVTDDDADAVTVLDGVTDSDEEGDADGEAGTGDTDRDGVCDGDRVCVGVSDGHSSPLSDLGPRCSAGRPVGSCVETAPCTPPPTPVTGWAVDEHSATIVMMHARIPRDMGRETLRRAQRRAGWLAVSWAGGCRRCPRGIANRVTRNGWGGACLLAGGQPRASVRVGGAHARQRIPVHHPPRRDKHREGGDRVRA